MRFLKVSVFVSDKTKQNIFAHNSFDFTCPHLCVFFRFQKSSFSSVHTRNGTELRNDVFSKHFTFESIFGRFGVDNSRKRINMYAIRKRMSVDGLTLLGRFVLSEYRAMLYSRLETQKKEREERKFKPPRAVKRQKTHEEPKVTTSNIGYNLGVVCSFL